MWSLPLVYRAIAVAFEFERSAKSLVKQGGESVEISSTAVKERGRMTLSTEGEEIEETGTTLDEKKRVYCNYCGSDVMPCTKVPYDVKEVGRTEHPGVSLKRNFSSAPSEMRHFQLKSTHSATPKVLRSNDTDYAVRIKFSCYQANLIEEGE